MRENGEVWVVVKPFSSLYRNGYKLLTPTEDSVFTEIETVARRNNDNEFLRKFLHVVEKVPSFGVINNLTQLSIESQNGPRVAYIATSGRNTPNCNYYRISIFIHDSERDLLIRCPESLFRTVAYPFRKGDERSRAFSKLILNAKMFGIEEAKNRRRVLHYSREFFKIRNEKHCSERFKVRYLQANYEGALLGIGQFFPLLFPLVFGCVCGLVVLVGELGMRRRERGGKKREIRNLEEIRANNVKIFRFLNSEMDPVKFNRYLLEFDAE